MQQKKSIGFYFLLGVLILLAVSLGVLRFHLIPQWNWENQQKKAAEIKALEDQVQAEKIAAEQAMTWSNLPVLDLSIPGTESATATSSSAASQISSPSGKATPDVKPSKNATSSTASSATAPIEK